MADKKPVGEAMKAGATLAGAAVVNLGDALVEAAAPYEVAYYYLSDKNPNGAFLPGVPLCDLHTAQVEQYPKWIQKSIKASPMYKAANASDEDEGEGGDK